MKKPVLCSLLNDKTMEKKNYSFLETTGQDLRRKGECTWRERPHWALELSFAGCPGAATSPESYSQLRRSMEFQEGVRAS